LLVCLALAAPRTAAAQTFLQDIPVDCGAGGLISTALAAITDRDGPNRIRLTGICSAEDVDIVGFNRLTIQGGATIKRRFSTFNSRSLTLRSLWFNFTGVPGTVVSLNDSQAVLDNVTVQGAAGDGIILRSGSHLAFAGARSTVTQSGNHGIDAAGGSVVNVVNVTISGNANIGARIYDAASVTLSNQLNGADAGVEVAGNGGGGIEVVGGTLTTDEWTTSAALVNIHDNMGAGISVASGIATITGQSAWPTTPAATLAATSTCSAPRWRSATVSRSPATLLRSSTRMCSSTAATAW
jgi:hypothetical protein